MLDYLARHLGERFQTAGAEVRILSSPLHGNQVFAFVSSSNSKTGMRPALVLCHYDTVWPVGTLQSRPFRIQGDKAWGPGVLDMKASLVIAEFALRTACALGVQFPRPVAILLTPDEEVLSPTSRPLIEEYARQSEYVLVLEPSLPDGSLKTARKGAWHFTLAIEGRSAHAGMAPEKGVSAIHELAYQILQLLGLGDSTSGTTVNIGVVCGGTQWNVVAAHAEADVDVRVWTLAEAERVRSAVLNLATKAPEAILQVREGFSSPPMERNPALFLRAQQIGHQLGLDLREGSAGSGSDANLTSALGVPTLDGLGAVGDGAHAINEHVLIDSLPVRAALLTSLLLDL